MKILVISLAGIGDTLLATPLIHELRENFPEAQIDALVLWAGSKDILQSNPYLNMVLRWNFLKESKIRTLRFLAELRRQRYDISINTHPQSRIHYRFIARAIAARIRISHVYENFGMFDRFLVNRTILQNYSIHTAEQNLALLPLINAKSLLIEHSLEIFLSNSDEKWADDFIASNKLSGRKILGIHAGSGGTKNLMLKRWPLENYIELLRALKGQRPEITALLFGGSEENQEILKILEVTGSPFAVQGATGNLLHAAALMKRCEGFLSVDTALMHLAAAMKVRGQIVIEAPTLNETNLPYGNSFTLIENPAVHGRNLDFYRYDGKGIRGTREELEKCMLSVSADRVLCVLSAKF